MFAQVGESEADVVGMMKVIAYDVALELINAFLICHIHTCELCVGGLKHYADFAAATAHAAAV